MQAVVSWTKTHFLYKGRLKEEMEKAEEEEEQKVSWCKWSKYKHFWHIALCLEHPKGHNSLTSKQFLIRIASLPKAVENALHSPSLSLLLKILLLLLPSPSCLPVQTHSCTLFSPCPAGMEDAVSHQGPGCWNMVGLLPCTGRVFP